MCNPDQVAPNSNVLIAPASTPAEESQQAEPSSHQRECSRFGNVPGGIRVKRFAVDKVAHRDDMIVNIEVRVPTKMTREQKKLFEQLLETLPSENEPQERGLLDKVKDPFV